MTGVAWHGFADGDKRENSARGATRASAERRSSKSRRGEVKHNLLITSWNPLELLTYITRFTIGSYTVNLPQDEVVVIAKV